MRQFSTKSYKDKVEHCLGTTEEVRPEYTRMYNELERYVDASMPMFKTYYEEAGKPKTTRINTYAYPPEILRAIG
jgi:hypothetical protein